MDEEQSQTSWNTRKHKLLHPHIHTHTHTHYSGKYEEAQGDSLMWSECVCVQTCSYFNIILQMETKKCLKYIVNRDWVIIFSTGSVWNHGKVHTRYTDLNAHLWPQIVCLMCTRHSQSGPRRTTHLHSHTSTGQSPTLQPLWSVISYRPSHHHSPQASNLSPTHTHTPVLHSNTQTVPLIVSSFFMFHVILYNEQMPHTETKKVSLYYTSQTSALVAPCNLVLLTLLLAGQMEPY